MVQGYGSLSFKYSGFCDDYFITPKQYIVRDKWLGVTEAGGEAGWGGKPGPAGTCRELLEGRAESGSSGQSHGAGPALC